MLNAQMYCGDYRKVLADVRADLILTSPPYNIGSRHPKEDGNRRFGLYDRKSYGAIRDYPDELSESVYQRQQVAFLRWCAAHLTPDGILVYNHKPRRKEGAMRHPAEWFLHAKVRSCLQLMEELVWDRGSTHNHSPHLMWPQTERLYVFRHVQGRYRLRNTASLPYRSDVWRLGRSRLKGHNAPFPVQLAEAAICAWSVPGALVCDPYAGSGTTGEAALRTGRAFVGAEILEKYYHLACARVATCEEMSA